MLPLAHYEQLAALFDYPRPDYPALVRTARRVLEGRYPAAAGQLAALGDALPAGGERFSAAALDELQDIFTRSFDVQSITTLSVGYVMFGDDYKRGELLVNLNHEHRKAGIDCGSELPDHLPNVLRLVARWEDREVVVEFVEEILQPAVERMIAEFGTERMQQRNQLYERHFKTLIAFSAERATIFREPLRTLLAVLREDFGLSTSVRAGLQSDFLRSISRELAIEAGEGRPAPSRSVL